MSRNRIKQPIPDERLAEAAETLRVLTHPDRLRICQLLLSADCCVSEICETLNLKQNVVSQHLNHLRARGLVAPRREGRSVYYQVVHQAPGWLLDCIRTHMGKRSAASKAKELHRE